MSTIMNKILLLISNCIKVNDIKPQIREFMVDKLNHYPDDWTLMQAAYHELFRNTSTICATCPVCKKILKFKGLKEGYPKNCSYKCRSKNPDTQIIYKETCNTKYGTDYASQSAEFRQIVKDTCFKKYGVNNVFKNKDIQQKQKKTVQEKYGVSNASKSDVVLANIKKSHIATGNWLPDEQKSEIELFRLEVKRISARSYHDHFYQINPNNVLRSRYQYHLDHIFSVEEGFKNKVPAKVIGHWTNLRMMWHLDNSIKNTKCHKSIEQLFEDYTTNK